MTNIVNPFIKFPVVDDDTTTTYDHMNDVGTTFSDTYGSNPVTCVGILTGAPAIGTYIQKLTISIRKVGAPPSTMEVGIWNEANAEVVKIDVTPNTIFTPVFALYEFDLLVKTLLKVDYKVGINYPNGGGVVSKRVDVELIHATTETGYNFTHATFALSNTSYDTLMTFDSSPDA